MIDGICFSVCSGYSVARLYGSPKLSSSSNEWKWWFKDFGMWKFHLRLNTLCDALFTITFGLILVCINGTLFFISAWCVWMMLSQWSTFCLIISELKKCGRVSSHYDINWMKTNLITRCGLISCCLTFEQFFFGLCGCLVYLRWPKQDCS